MYPKFYITPRGRRSLTSNLCIMDYTKAMNWKVVSSDSKNKQFKELSSICKWHNYLFFSSNLLQDRICIVF